MRGTLDKIESREWITVDNDGLTLFGVLHRPTGVDNPPVVVIHHGFASSKSGSNRCYVTLAESLAKDGIAALRFDFRGSGDSEGSLNDASFEELISDALAVTEYASAMEEVDRDRMGFFGASLGGSLAVEACARSKIPKALALWAPVASGELWFRDFLIRHPEMRQASPDQILGTYRGIQVNARFKEQFAQLFAYKTIAGMPHLPLLHLHGEADDTITITHQEAFKQAAGPNATFITYPEAAHSLGYAKAFPEAIQKLTAFFKEHL